MSPAEIYYRQELDAASLQTASADRVLRRVAWLRLLIIGVAIVVLLMRRSSADAELWSIAALATLMFSGAVWWHRRLRAEAEHWRQRSAALAQGLARIERRWHQMAPWRPVPVSAGHPAVIARDLSVLGEHSLLRLLDVTHPALGGQRVCEWLLADPPAVDVIEARQASVGDLRGRPDVLLAAAMIARSRDAFISARALGAFREWCRQPDPASQWYVTTSWISGVAVLALAVGALVQRAAPAAWFLWPVLAFHLAFAARARRQLQRTFGDVEASLAQLGSTTRMMALLVATAPTRGRLAAIQRRLDEERAVGALSALVRLLEWNAIRYSPAAHWALNAAIGFDVHLLAALERWRHANAERTVGWLDETADAEALLAFGTLAYEHEHWSLPMVSESSAPLLSARGVTHPLLAAEVAVPNDVELTASGDVVVVSGPNMAGKTTLLRALGLNVLLAQAGSVVSAEHLQVRRCRPRTSVRVEDDLSEGISLFMAEVLRLRDVIHDAEGREGPPVLFLFDEILHGTNAADRRVATRRVLARLQRAGAAGFITTHDPQIVPPSEPRTGANPGVTPRTAHIHFDGSVSAEPGGGLALRFDYRAKPGPSTHTNALAVLEMLGIHAEPENASGADTHVK